MFIVFNLQHTILYSLTKFPTSHLIQAQLIGIIVGRQIISQYTNVVCNIECLIDGKLYIMENGIGRSRLLFFTTGASTGKRSFPITKVCMSAFSAHKTTLPLYVGNKFQNFFAIIK